MDSHRSSSPSWPYHLAFALALALRFTQLGALPLGDAEANSALQALQVARGEAPALGPHVAYLHLTAALFFLFGSTNFLSRFWPALAGSALVYLPLLFRRRIDSHTGLLLAFALALDPGLVALSRQAGGTLLALASLMLAWGFWEAKRPRLAGLFGGLALLSGSTLWNGLLGLGLACLLWRGMRPRNLKARPEAGSGLGPERSADLWEAVRYGGGTVLLVGSLLLLSPQGLGAATTSLLAYLRRWWLPSGVSIGRSLLALVVYQPLALLMALPALVRGWERGDRRVVQLGLWLVSALVVALAAPGRTMDDLAWALLPLWTLAAMEMSRALRLYPEERREVGAVALLTGIILTFLWLNFSGLALDPTQPLNAIPVPVAGIPLLPARYLLLISASLLLAVSLVLIAAGWSVRLARLGGLWGLTVTLFIYTLGVAWGATGLRTPDGSELWVSGPRVIQADLLRQTVDDLSRWRLGHEDAQEVVVTGVNSPALLWALRNHPVRIVDHPGATESPPLWITPQVAASDLSASYRGQDFLWRRFVNWEAMTSGDWLHWVVFRTTIQTDEKIILWVRNDVFEYNGAPDTP